MEREEIKIIEEKWNVAIRFLRKNIDTLRGGLGGVVAAGGRDHHEEGRWIGGMVLNKRDAGKEREWGAERSGGEGRRKRMRSGRERASKERKK